MNETEDYIPFLTESENSEIHKELNDTNENVKPKQYLVHPPSFSNTTSPRCIRIDHKVSNHSLKENDYQIRSSSNSFSPYRNYSDKRKCLNIDTVAHINYKFFPSRSNRSPRLFTPQKFQISYYQNTRSSKIIPVVKGISYNFLK